MSPMMRKMMAQKALEIYGELERMRRTLAENGFMHDSAVIESIVQSQDEMAEVHDYFM